MADISAGRSRTSDRPSVAWWRDERKRGLIWQIVVVAILCLGVWFIIDNMAANLRAMGVPLGFGFLDAPAGFAISSSLIQTDLNSSIGRLIVAGMLNTLLAAAISIVLATIIGVIIGVCRLSRNYLVSRLATAYVEALRNIPLLVQLLFWYAATIQLFPNVRKAISVFDLMFLTQRGVYVPRPIAEDDLGIVFVALLVGIGVALGVGRWARKRQEATGQQFPKVRVGLAIVVGLPLVASLLLGAPVTWEVPELKGFNFRGGMVMLPELTALVLGMSMYTAAFIAEIVRGGILAIPRGQSEAAIALGLSEFARLRYVVIPQAIRIMIPPLANQFLNLTKNSSLAVFIGYPEIARITGIIISQGNPELQPLSILMLSYLSISLTIASITNVVNRRLQLTTR